MNKENLANLTKATKEAEKSIQHSFPDYKINTEIDYPTLTFNCRNGRIIKLDISRNETFLTWKKIILKAEELYFVGKL